MDRRENMPRFNTRKGLPPHIDKPDALLSLQWLGGELYFINESDEVLELVRAKEWGFCGELALQSDIVFEYKTIKSNEGVKVYDAPDPTDGMYGDFIKGIYIYVKSEKLGSIRISPKHTYKGMIDQALILENMKETGSVIVVEWIGKVE